MAENENLPAKAGETPLAPHSSADQTFALLQQAVQAGTTPEALEKLVELQERILARNAESDYAAALSAFQSRCPAITKRKEVKNKHGHTIYHFAPLEDIVEQVRPLLHELGLSYSFGTDHADSGVNVFCTVRHQSGHQETSMVHVPHTKGQLTNAAQDMGIQVKYGQRYAFCCALGITTADEDRDGRGQQELCPLSPDHLQALQALAKEVDADTSRFFVYLKVNGWGDISEQDYERAVAALEAKRKQGQA